MKMKTLPVLAMVIAASSLIFAADLVDAVRITQGPVVEGVGDKWAVIAWTTNTGSSSVIHYGTDPKNLSQTADAPYSDNESTASQNHRVRLTGLTPGFAYYFTAVSGQGEGTGTQTTSRIGRFSTKSGSPAGMTEALKITDGPRVEGTGSTWAVIAWTTNTGGSSIVRYGFDPNRLGQMAESSYSDNEKTKAQNHRVRLSNLKPDTKYFFISDSAQGEGTGTDSAQGEGTGTEAKSSVGQFTTKAH